MASEIVRATGQHIVLVTVAVIVASVAGIPIGILCVRHARWGKVALRLIDVIQTIPSLALFGFLIPLPLIGGIGPRTAVVALVLYGLLPIVRNTYTGITGVDPAVREAGRGVGMTDRQLLLMADLPLALGVIVAGVRIA